MAPAVEGGDGTRLHHVTIEEMRFVPEELDIAVGDTVRWTVAAACPIKHFIEVVNMVGGVVVEPPPLLPGKSFEWTFDTAGEFCAVSCVYSFMRGEVYAASVTPAPATGSDSPQRESEGEVLPSPRVEAATLDAGEASDEPTWAPREAKGRAGLSLLPPTGPGSMSACSLLSSPVPRLAAPRVPAVELRQGPGTDKPTKAKAAEDDAEGGYDAEGEEEGAAQGAPAASTGAEVPSRASETKAGSNGEERATAQLPPMEDAPEVGELASCRLPASPSTDGAAEASVVAKPTAPATAQAPAKVEEGFPPVRIAKLPGPPGNELMLPVDPGSVLELHDPIPSQPKRGAPGGSHHVFRCRRCRAHFVSLFNSQRCSAMHSTRRVSSGAPSNGAGSNSGIGSASPVAGHVVHHLPDHAELLAFWAGLKPSKAASILDLRTPGETGELILREVAATGADALGNPEDKNERGYRGSYWDAARQLYAIASGATLPPAEPAVLFDLLTAASEGTFLGASVKGSLAEMVEVNNLGAALALLMEGRAAAEWLKWKEELLEAQKPRVRSEKSRERDKLRRQRQRAQKKRRAQGAGSATEDTCGNTTTTLDEATTTDADVAAHGRDSDAEASPSGDSPPDGGESEPAPLHTVSEAASEAVEVEATPLVTDASEEFSGARLREAERRPPARSDPLATTACASATPPAAAPAADPAPEAAVTPPPAVPRLRFGTVDMAEVMSGTAKASPIGHAPVLFPRPQAHGPATPSEDILGIINAGYRGRAARAAPRPSLFPPNTYPLPPLPAPNGHFSPFLPTAGTSLPPGGGSVVMGIPVTSITPGGMYLPPPGVTSFTPLPLHNPPATGLPAAPQPGLPPPGLSPTAHPSSPPADSVSPPRPLPQPAPSGCRPPADEAAQPTSTTSGPPPAELEASAEESGGNQQAASLRGANQYFAGLLRTMHENAAAAQDLKAPGHRKEEEMRETETHQVSFAAAAASSKPRSRFDPDAALSMFRGRWQAAEAEIAQGRGRRHG
eukprot:jgi/Tetstr1/460521/TSEL_005780.t1